MFDFKHVLQEDHVPFLRPVLHLGLERGAERVESVAARSHFLVGEEAEPAQSGNDTLLFIIVLKLRPRRDGSYKITDETDQRLRLA